MGCPQPDTNDDELRRFDRRDADDTDQAPTVDVGLRHRRAVAFHEISLFGLRSLERAVAQAQRQKIRDRPAPSGPERPRVRLEAPPLHPAVYRGLDEDQQAADIDVLPVRIARDAAPAVDADAAIVGAKIA